MPRPSGKPLRKECESCGQQIPVACKTCPECSHELIPEKDKERDTSAMQLSPDLAEADSEQGERRRSVRAKRDKPDYYDALDYDSKRQNKQPRTPGGSTPYAQKRGSFSSRGSPGGVQARRAIGYSSYSPGPTRATLSWRKGGGVEEDEMGKKKGKKPNDAYVDECDETPLEEKQVARPIDHASRAILAVKNHNLPELEQVLDTEGLPVETRDQHGNSLFILACQQGSKKLAKFLLRRGADINAQNNGGNTSLHYLYEYKHVSLAEYLIRKGANDAAKNAEGLTPYEGLSVS